MSTLSTEEQAIVAAVREFVDRDVRPVVRELEHADTYPEALVERMEGRARSRAHPLGVGQAAFEDSLRYAQERASFGRPIWQHQSIGNHLADMATSPTAARQLVLHGGYGCSTEFDIERYSRDAPLMKRGGLSSARRR